MRGERQSEGEGQRVAGGGRGEGRDTPSYQDL